MISSFRAELLKLRKRPAVWVLLLVLVVLVSVMGYFLSYLFYLTMAAGKVSSDVPPSHYLDQLLPSGLARTPVAFVTYGDYAIGVVLGALVAGSEYEWGTLKTVLTQRPRRASMYLAKLLAVVVVVAGMVVVVFAFGAVCSLVITYLAGPGTSTHAVSWPGLGSVLKGMGAEWLILSMWASMGLMFAVLFRSPGLGIGLGIGEWVVEQVVTQQGAKLSHIVGVVSPFLPGVNYASLSVATSQNVVSFVQGVVTQSPGSIDAARAAMTVGAYTLAFVVVAGLVLRARDVL